MKKLRVLVLVLLCTVLAMPLHASAGRSVLQVPVLVQNENSSPANILTPATVAADSEAVLQIDNKGLLLPLLQQFINQLYFTGTDHETLTDTPCFALRQNGLHTILTAGP